MKPLLLSLLASCSCFVAAQTGDGYTITTTLRIAKPYRLAAMNDEFQSATLISEKDGVGTFRITYRPLHAQQVGSDPNWRKDDAGMTDYLKPRPCANWDPALRSQILSDLHDDGIDPSGLDDRTLVEKVSRWALQRSSFNDQFGLWMVRFVAGKPSVPPELKDAFAQNEPKGMPLQTIYDRELYGKGMYLAKTHGACTSTSTYMATILRAIGIPTRIVVTIPACDPNDEDQIRKLIAAVRYHRIAYQIREGTAGSGFTNHLYNEVWVGKKWVRLNYDRLGQPILDPNYLGLMTHIDTAADVSDIPFASTWGPRYGLGKGPKLSSENPYQMLTASDAVARGFTMANPPMPELTAVTVVKVAKAGDPSLPDFVRSEKGFDALLCVKEWIKQENYLQMRDFVADAPTRFTLQAPGRPSIEAQLTSYKYCDGNGTFQAYGIKLLTPPTPGVTYSISPHQQTHSHTWTFTPDAVWHS